MEQGAAGTGSLIRVDLWESRGKERETMISVSEAFQCLRSMGERTNCLNTVHSSTGWDGENLGQGGRMEFQGGDRPLSLFTPSRMKSNKSFLT